MDNILSKLKESGVHILINDEQIMLEVFKGNLHQPDKVDFLIDELLTTTTNKPKKILLEYPQSYSKKLNRTTKKMKVRGERTIYKKSLKNPINIGNIDFELWSFSEAKSISFLSEIMNKNIEETEKFLMSMKIELPSQAENMFTVYIVENKPVGVVLPHIEPDTDKEGRLFWIGIHPKYRRKGYGESLHLLGLYRLQNDFKAETYVGATEMDNKPMRKIMLSNGCIESNRTVVLES